MIHPDNGKYSGIFQGIRLLREKYELSNWEERIINKLEMKMENIPEPKELDDWNTKRWISWFKNTANEIINSCYDIIPIFEQRGIQVNVRKERKITNVVYEDDYQILQLNRDKIA